MEQDPAGILHDLNLGNIFNHQDMNRCSPDGNADSVGSPYYKANTQFPVLLYHMGSHPFIAVIIHACIKEKDVLQQHCVIVAHCHHHVF